MPTLLGRSSSHFTRIARIFLLEAKVPFDFQPIHDLMSLDTSNYADNPALKLPIWLGDDGPLYGSQNICREALRLGSRKPDVAWPEDMPCTLTRNASEIATQALATQVSVILCRLTGVPSDNAMRVKAEASLKDSVFWLDRHLDEALAELKKWDLSLLEVSLYCLGEHLDFRETLKLSDYPRLNAFCGAFGERPSARETPFRFDTPPES